MMNVQDLEMLSELRRQEVERAVEKAVLLSQLPPAPVPAWRKRVAEGLIAVAAKLEPTPGPAAAARRSLAHQ